MNIKKRSMRRIAAGVGVFALAMAGVVGASSAASATTVNGTPPGNTDPGTKGSLTVHKRVGAQGEAGNGTEITTPPGAPGTPLGGVDFTVQRIGTSVGGDCVAIDLRTEAGWAAAQGIIATPQTVTPCNVAGGATTKTTATTVNVGEAVFGDLALGLYYVTEGDAPAHVVEKALPFYVTVPYPSTSGTAPNTTTTWLYDVHVYPKNAIADAPTKTINGQQTDLVLNADVTWTISQTIPTLTGAGSVFTEASVKDTLDPRLTLSSSTVQIKDGDTVLATLTGTFPTVGATGALTWTLDEASRNLLKANPGKSLVVTVETTVTSVGTGSTAGVIKNKGTVSFNNKPQDTNEPYTYWGALEVIKHDSVSLSQTLAGAHFEVFDNATGTPSTCSTTKPGSGALATGVSNTSGVVEWERADQLAPKVTELGLWIANSNTAIANASKVYCLYETQAPAGYSIDTPNPQAVTISTANTNALTTTPVANTKVPGPNLPLTGSTGTALFVSGGMALILVAGGAAMIAARRKQGSVK